MQFNIGDTRQRLHTSPIPSKRPSHFFSDMCVEVDKKEKIQKLRRLDSPTSPDGQSLSPTYVSINVSNKASPKAEAQKRSVSPKGLYPPSIQKFLSGRCSAGDALNKLKTPNSNKAHKESIEKMRLLGALQNQDIEGSVISRKTSSPSPGYSPYYSTSPQCASPKTGVSPRGGNGSAIIEESPIIMTIDDNKMVTSPVCDPIEAMPMEYAKAPVNMEAWQKNVMGYRNSSNTTNGSIFSQTTQDTRRGSFHGNNNVVNGRNSVGSQNLPYEPFPNIPNIQNRNSIGSQNFPNIEPSFQNRNSLGSRNVQQQYEQKNININNQYGSYNNIAPSHHQQVQQLGGSQSFPIEVGGGAEEYEPRERTNSFLRDGGLGFDLQQFQIMNKHNVGQGVPDCKSIVENQLAAIKNLVQHKRTISPVEHKRVTSPPVEQQRAMNQYFQKRNSNPENIIRDPTSQPFNQINHMNPFANPYQNQNQGYQQQQQGGNTQFYNQNQSQNQMQVQAQVQVQNQNNNFVEETKTVKGFSFGIMDNKPIQGQDAGLNAYQNFMNNNGVSSETTLEQSGSNQDLPNFNDFDPFSGAASRGTGSDMLEPEAFFGGRNESDFDMNIIQSEFPFIHKNDFDLGFDDPLNPVMDGFHHDDFNRRFADR